MSQDRVHQAVHAVARFIGSKDCVDLKAMLSAYAVVGLIFVGVIAITERIFNKGVTRI